MGRIKTLKLLAAFSGLYLLEVDSEVQPPFLLKHNDFFNIYTVTCLEMRDEALECQEHLHARVGTEANKREPLRLNNGLGRMFIATCQLHQHYHLYGADLDP